VSDFVHLHLHSEYSLLDGACRIADIPRKAKEMGHTAVAITDHGAMYGAVSFYKACRAEGVKPIIGCEVYVARRSMYDKERELDAKSCHLVLLCKNETGYRNLCILVSKAYTDGFYSKPRIDLELLKHHSEGLIALSACLAGFIPRAILAGEYEKAEAHAKEMLTSMSGGTQEVYTGVCVISHGEKKLFAEKTYVSFRPLSEREIDDYIATGESLDKAGAYGIQGGAGEFVSSVRGDYFNVIGLPMKKTALVLEEILKTHSEW